MKKTIIIISLLIGIASSAIAAKETADKPVQVEFATKLVSVFGGQDKALSETELTRVLAFLQESLPEQVAPSSLTARLSREYNVNSAARGDMSDERFALREYPERIRHESPILGHPASLKEAEPFRNAQ